MLRRLVAPGLGGGAGRILRGAGPAPWLAAARDVGFRSCSSQTPLAGQHGAIGLVWGDSDVTVHMPLPGVAGISALSFRGNETEAEVAGRLTQRDQSLHEASFTDAAGNPLPHATRLADLFPGRAFLALNGLSFGLSRAPSPKPATPPSVVNAVEAAVRREEAAVMDRAALCNLCVDCGGATTDAPAVLAALEQKGVLLQPRASSPQSCIILNPDGARDRIIRALDTDGAAIREAVAAKAADVAAKEERLSTLLQTKAEADAVSYQRFRRLAWASLAGLSTQVGVLAYATWGVYSWDVMEPFTYFLGMGVVWASFSFARHKEEPDYSTLRDRYLRRTRARMYAQRGFDPEECAGIEASLSHLRAELNALR